MNSITHALFWSLAANIGCYVVVSLMRAPTGQEASQATLFVDVFKRERAAPSTFWRGSAHRCRTCCRWCRASSARPRRSSCSAEYARARLPGIEQFKADADLVHFAETQLAGAIGSASAHVMVSSVVQEEPLGLDEVMDILDEASQVRAYSPARGEVARAGGRTEELRAANERLKELDRLKDDIMSSVTHELRTPLTSIRALSEMLLDDPEMDVGPHALPGHHRLGDRAPDAAGEPGARSGQDRIRPRRMAQFGCRHEGAGRARCRGDPASCSATAVRRSRSLAGRGAAVLADHDRLLQVMLNLLSNAAKFVPKGEGRVKRRNGSGRRPGSRSRCGQRSRHCPGFHALRVRQVPPGRRPADRPAGHGLGLPISRQIIEHFGGRMWVESQPGEGATFILTAASAKASRTLRS
jgi:signal transduction histidine kinase